MDSIGKLLLGLGLVLLATGIAIILLSRYGTFGASSLKIPPGSLRRTSRRAAGPSDGTLASGLAYRHTVC